MAFFAADFEQALDEEVPSSEVGVSAMYCTIKDIVHRIKRTGAVVRLFSYVYLSCGMRSILMITRRRFVSGHVTQ